MKAERRPSFTQADVTRAIKGANNAGMEVGRVEIDPATRKIVIFAGGHNGATPNEWDSVLK